MTDLSDGMQGRHLPTTNMAETLVAVQVLLLLQILCLQCQHCFCYWNMADTLLAVAHALQPIHYSAIATATADTLLATATATATWLTLCLQC